MFRENASKNNSWLALCLLLLLGGLQRTTSTLISVLQKLAVSLFLVSNPALHKCHIHSPLSELFMSSQIKGESHNLVGTPRKWGPLLIWHSQSGRHRDITHTQGWIQVSTGPPGKKVFSPSFFSLPPLAYTSLHDIHIPYTCLCMFSLLTHAHLPKLPSYSLLLGTRERCLHLEAPLWLLPSAHSYPAMLHSSDS